MDVYNQTNYDMEWRFQMSTGNGAVILKARENPTYSEIFSS
jgi:hypothetical protein